VHAHQNQGMVYTRALKKMWITASFGPKLILVYKSSVLSVLATLIEGLLLHMFTTLLSDL
jgi:hypothetical protein